MQRQATLLGLALLCVAARSSGQNTAVSEELFQRGVAALKAEDFASACPALTESQRLDPRAGTLFTLADCEARWGKLATASSHFLDYLSQTAALPAPQAAKHAERRQNAEKKLAEMRPLVPRLTLVPPPDFTEILLDGVLLGRASLKIPLPVDPGEHLVLVRAGQAEKSRAITIARGESQVVDLPRPEASSTASSAASSAAPFAPPLAPAGPAPVGAAGPAASAPSRGLSPAVYVAGGVGLAGVIVGSIAGVQALRLGHEAQQDCQGSRCSSLAGVDAGIRANRAAIVSDIGLGVGVIGLGAAAFFWLRGASEPAPGAAAWRLTPAFSVAGGGLQLGGGW